MALTIDFSKHVCYNKMEWIDETGGILPFRKIAFGTGYFFLRISRGQYVKNFYVKGENNHDENCRLYR